MLTLYHGSKSGIVGPIRPASRSTCDFGPAFYTGVDPRQPLTLVCRAAHPKFYELSFDEYGLRSLDIGEGALWALFVAYNRGELNDPSMNPLVSRLKTMTEGLDVLRGRIADDRVFQAVQMFFDRTITLETLSAVLKAVNLGTQVCMLSPQACSRVKIVTVRDIDESERERLRETSENQRKKAVELTDKIIDSRRRTDGIYFDELCEKYRSGEGLC